MTEDQRKKRCGKQTRWCRCGEKPPGGHKGPFPAGHKQNEHAVDPVTGKRRGPCTREGCTCQGFAGWPCEDGITMDNGRCYRHGGKSLVGPATPQFKGGFSKVLPAPLATLYESALLDPRRLSLEQEIGVISALWMDLVEKMPDGKVVSEDLFSAHHAVLSAWRQFIRAYQAGATDRLAEALPRLESAMSAMRGAGEPARQYAAAREESRRFGLVLARLKRDENERLTDLHNMVPIDIAMADRVQLVRAMLEAVDKYVRDPEARSGIRLAASTIYKRLTSRRDDSPAGSRDRAEVDAEYSTADD